MKFRPDAPLSEAARQHLAKRGQGSPRPPWWTRLQAFAIKDSHWYCWRAGDDEPEPPVQ